MGTPKIDYTRFRNFCHTQAYRLRLGLISCATMQHLITRLHAYACKNCHPGVKLWTKMTPKLKIKLDQPRNI